MKFFICAAEDFALRADGEFLGNFHGDACLENFSPAFIEILPHSGLSPTCFFADYPLKSHKNAVFCNLPNGDVFASVSFRPNINAGFKTLFQKFLPEVDALVTVVFDGNLKISAENRNDYETVCAPAGFSDFSATVFDGKIAVYSSKSPAFAVVFSADTLEVLFSKIVEEIEFTPVLRTKTRLPGIERATVSCEWKGLPLTPSIAEIKRENEWSVSVCRSFSERAFFERLFYRLPVTEMLSDGLKPNEHRLREYVGNFDIILPDYCVKKGVCLSFEESGKRLTKTFELDFENGLICNLREI